MRKEILWSYLYGVGGFSTMLQSQLDWLQNHEKELMHLKMHEVLREFVFCEWKWKWKAPAKHLHEQYASSWFHASMWRSPKKSDLDPCCLKNIKGTTNQTPPSISKMTCNIMYQLHKHSTNYKTSPQFFFQGNELLDIIWQIQTNLQW